MRQQQRQQSQTRTRGFFDTIKKSFEMFSSAIPRWNTLQHAATHCNTLLRLEECSIQTKRVWKSFHLQCDTATHYKVYKNFDTNKKESWHIFICNVTLQHTATHYNTLQLSTRKICTNKTQTRNITVCNVTLQHSATQCKGAVKHFHLQCNTKRYLDTNKNKS